MKNFSESYPEARKRCHQKREYFKGFLEMKTRDIKKLTTGTEGKCEGLSQKVEQKDKDRK